MAETCKHCGSDLPSLDRVSIWGMFDMHLFWRYEGATVDEVIKNWLTHIADPIPAKVDGHKIPS